MAATNTENTVHVTMFSFERASLTDRVAFADRPGPRP
jgi:hypothetical protein